MFRQFITAIIFASLASTAFAASVVNYIEVKNKDSNNSVTVNYNSITKQTSSETMTVPPNQSVVTGIPPIDQEMPKYEITAISTNIPITSCPILNFNTVYNVILITIAKDGSCTAVTNVGK